MKNKKILSLLVAGGTALSIIGGSKLAYARAVDTYGQFTVPTINDKETSNLTKTNNTKGVNNVDYIQRGELVCWIESSGGSNITEKKTYTTAYRMTLQFNDAQSQINKEMHLNISTSPSYWSTVDTKGSWSPDEN